MSLRVVFMGTPEFAVPALNALTAGPDDLLAVFTQPDRGAGRGRRPKPSPVKRKALEAGIPVLEPPSIKAEDAIRGLRDLSPDLIVVVAYGQILPEAIIELPPLGCLNVHASLLPRYRGAAPIQWALINGESKTGVTVIHMNERMDAGDILAARALSIGEEENAADLSDRLSYLGAELLMETLRNLEEGSLRPVPQREEEATSAPRLRKTDGEIRWDQGAEKIARLVRALSPWPGAHTYWRGRRLKVHRASARPARMTGEPGEVIRADDGGLWVRAEEGYLDIKEVQLENRPKMPATAFVQGHAGILGDTLGRETN